MTRPLVVNADDLGLSRGINAAIRRAHVDGIVTSTSLLTVGRYAADAAAMLRATPSLAAGVHLALVGEDPPLLSAREVPTLVDRAGRFPLSYRTFVARAATGRVDLDDVRRELGAQVQAGLDLGLELGHLDTHQHVHLWPGVGAVVVDLAEQHGIAHVRLPRAHGRSPIGLGVGVLSRRLRDRLVAHGLPVTAYAGLEEAGGMDRAALGRAFRALAATPAAAAEVNVHPGLVDADSSRFDWGYRWEDELAALLDPDVRADLSAHGFHPSTFPVIIGGS
ncbi:MAG: ChbG/HpnK family deacetylase [Actinobacteria bacterium]|nr:ChbG/HpnK family deacetylase [Actinomycetota bacterium]